MKQTHYSTCTLCEAMCGIEVTTEDKHIISIKGDKDNPFSQGYICPKASTLKDFYDDPERLQAPVKKTADGWQEISWDEAFDLAATNIHKIQSEHGNDAVGMYLGNPNAHNMGAMLFGPYFYRALRSKNRFSATSVDQLPHHIVSRQLFGHQMQIPIPDIDHTDYFMIIGGNPLASNGSIMTVPNIKKRLKEIQKRGGKVVVIDPKRSETAAISSDHHFIKPGTDVLLLLAMLNTLFAKNLHSPDALSKYAPDLLDVANYVSEYTPRAVADKIGISAQTINTLTVEFAHADSAICYGRMGASVQSFGTLTQYLITLFNMLTGNLDKRGGMMFTQPAVNTLPHSGRGSIASFHSRVRGLPSFAGELPVAALAEEMLTPGEGQIKAMIIGAGNPVLTTPNGPQLDSAMAQLDYVLAIDFYINETNRHANLILPPVTALQRDHYDVVFHKFAVRNTASFSAPLFEPTDTELSDWQIYLELAKRLETLNEQATGHFDVLFKKQPRGVINDLLTSGKYGKSHHLSVQKLLDNPHGIDLGDLQPCIEDALFHEDKRIHLCFDYFMPDLARVRRDFFDRASTHNFVLIGRRHLKSNNSWLHNNPRMLKGNNNCHAQIHPQSADSAGIKDGELIQVSSRVGSVKIIVDVTEDIMPGVISIPHGWGHKFEDTSWSTAKANAGVSCNDLTDHMLIDELSGNAALNGVPVKVTSASA